MEPSPLRGSSLPAAAETAGSRGQVEVRPSTVTTASRWPIDAIDATRAVVDWVAVGGPVPDDLASHVFPRRRGR